MSIDLSVCIIAYHNFDDIRVAISSLEKYTSNKIRKQIYIIDNGSENATKNEKEKIDNILSRYNDVTYIDAKENLGFGKGNNYILPILTSKYHCIMNPDVIFNEDAFSPIIEYLDNNSSVGMVIPNIVDETGNRVAVYRQELTIFDMFIRMFFKNNFKKRQEWHTMQYEDYSKPFQVPFGQGSFLVIKTELFKRINGFDERYFMYMEDADLCKRVNQVSKLMYFPGATVVHKWQRGSHKNKKLFKYHIESMRHYFKKWGYKWI